MPKEHNLQTLVGGDASLDASSHIGNISLHMEARGKIAKIDVMFVRHRKHQEVLMVAVAVENPI